jgi:hypothetical protein
VTKIDPKRAEELINNLPIKQKQTGVPVTQITYRKRPHIGILLGNAHYVLFKEMEKLTARAEAGQELTPAESVKFTKYCEVLARLSREEREQDKEDSPEKLSDEELRVAARVALAQLEDPEGKAGRE